MLTILDSFLNRLTMYRLLTYGLVGLVIISVGLSLTGALSMSVLGMALSLVLIGVGGFTTNQILARIWRIPLNEESGLLTALILFFIMPTPTSVMTGALLVLAGAGAAASKFFLAYRGAHVFNPAAAAASALGVVGLLHASWWVGSAALWPFTLILGLLVVRKIRRFSLLFGFLAASLVVSIVTLLVNHSDLSTSLPVILVSSPLIFLGTIMLTEPSTMPAHRTEQVIFGVIVGALYSMHISIGPVFVYPEVALLIGNLYAFAVSPKFHTKLRLREIQHISDSVANYIFESLRRLAFQPGQYMEWTLPGVGYNSRGNRRSFTIASSPTESTIQMGVKFYQPSSLYKQKLRAMKPGDTIVAGQVCGDFTLPRDPSRKVAMIAGGIGITPFRSMIQHQIDTQSNRDIVLLYSARAEADLAYRDVFNQAKAHNVRSYFQASGSGQDRATTPEQLRKIIPDYAERVFYISGPPAMVESSHHSLRQLGVAAHNIETDAFFGY